MTINQKKRLYKVLFIHLAIILCGFIYYCFIQLTGLSIPCFFHEITGLKCPGCGTTTLILNLLTGNIYNAFIANPITFIILPLLILFDIWYSISYIKYDYFTIPKIIQKMPWIIIIIYVTFGFLRNIPIIYQW